MTGSLPGPTWRGIGRPLAGGGPELPDVGRLAGRKRRPSWSRSRRRRWWSSWPSPRSSCGSTAARPSPTWTTWPPVAPTSPAPGPPTPTPRGRISDGASCSCSRSWWARIVLIALGAAAVLFLRDQPPAMVLALLVLIPVFLLLLVVASLRLAGAARLRGPDPARGQRSPAATRWASVWGLARAWPLAFFLYVVLKIVFGVVQGVILLRRRVPHLLLHPHPRGDADVPAAALLLRARLAALPAPADGL